MKSISDSDEQKKVVSFFLEKMGVTPSVVAPGDIHPSDANERLCSVVCLWREKLSIS